MSGCQCKTGFFVLRDCGEPVADMCTVCRRVICRRHSSPASVGHAGQCLDCAARAEQAAAKRARQNAKDNPAPSRHRSVDDNDIVDAAWVYGYRHRFYSSGYAPISAGGHHSSYYDNYDSRSFDNLQVERDDLGDGMGVGFGDS